MLTAHGSLPSAIAAVRSGAADYLLKPVTIDYLRERIGCILGQAQQVQQRQEQLQTMYVQMRGFLAREGMLELGGAPPEAPAAVIHSGPLYLDLRQHIVQMDGVSVLTTPIEFAILVELLRQSGSVISCTTLVRATNTVASDEEEARQLIRPHIVRLRRKLEPDPQQPRFLISVRGIGYRWVN